jgi:hypothetical protein
MREIYSSYAEECVRHLGVSMVMKVNSVYIVDDISILAYRKDL